MIRVFLLDDHEIVRRGLVDLLESAGDIEVVGQCGTALDAPELIRTARPDVAIFDVRLPDGSGVEACRQVRADNPAVKGLMLTSYDDDRALLAAALAGASGYLLKDIKGNGLITAVREAAAGEHLFDERQKARITDLRHGRAGSFDSRLGLLTPQERRILDLVATGLTNRQIGGRLCLAEKTVKNYVTSILAKLGLGSRTQAAVYLTSRGTGPQR